MWGFHRAFVLVGGLGVFYLVSVFVGRTLRAGGVYSE